MMILLRIGTACYQSLFMMSAYATGKYLLEMSINNIYNWLYIQLQSKIEYATGKHIS